MLGSCADFWRDACSRTWVALSPVLKYMSSGILGKPVVYPPRYDAYAMTGCDFNEVQLPWRHVVFHFY